MIDIKPKEGEQLCKFCGLCCEGFFHCKAYIYNQEDERIALKIKAHVFTDANKQLCFTLPCPAHNQLCTIYPKRPSVCIKHKCNLLKSVQSGAIQLQKGQAIVGLMKKIVQLLEKDLQKTIKKKNIKEISMLMRDFYNKFPDNKIPVEIKKKYAVRLFNYAKFQFIKEKYFYK